MSNRGCLSRRQTKADLFRVPSVFQTKQIQQKHCNFASLKDCCRMTSFLQLRLCGTKKRTRARFRLKAVGEWFAWKSDAFTLNPEAFERPIRNQVAGFLSEIDTYSRMIYLENLSCLWTEENIYCHDDESFIILTQRYICTDLLLGNWCVSNPGLRYFTERAWLLGPGRVLSNLSDIQHPDLRHGDYKPLWPHMHYMFDVFFSSDCPPLVALL